MSLGFVLLIEYVIQELKNKIPALEMLEFYLNSQGTKKGFESSDLSRSFPYTFIITYFLCFSSGLKFLCYNFFMEEFTHYTVMKNEAVDALECQDGKIYVDCTLGGGGHSGLILSRIQPNGRLIAFDVDEDAIKASSERLKDYKNLTIVKDSYTNIKEVLHSLGVEKITGGVLFDLGASYHQFHKGERGFSFSKEAPLDMRFNQDAEP